MGRCFLAESTPVQMRSIPYPTIPALKKAVELARTKAQALAEASGRTLGDVVSIEEYSDNQYGRYIDGGVNLQKESVSMAAGAENAVEDMNVMPGEMEVDANIKIVFSMVD